MSVIGLVEACFDPIYLDGRGVGHQDPEGPFPSRLQCFVLLPVDEDPVDQLKPVGFRMDNTFINGLELRPDLFFSIG